MQNRDLLPWHIYVATLNGTDKSYVGITSGSVKKRWSAHRSAAKNNPGTTNHFQRALRKYGSEAFDWQWIGTALNKEDANRAERTFIAAGWSHYNKTIGGEGCNGAVRSQETRDKISAAKSGISNGPHTPEARALMSEVVKARFQDKPVSEETKKRMSVSKTGKSLSQDHRQSISEAHKGRKKTAEHIANSARARSKPSTAEAVAKQEAGRKAARARRKEFKELILSMGTCPSIVEVADG